MLLNFGIETLGDIVEIGTGKFSANTSLVYDVRSFSFGEQRSRIYRLATELYEMGVGGSTVSRSWRRTPTPMSRSMPPAK